MKKLILVISLVTVISVQLTGCGIGGRAVRETETQTTSTPFTRNMSQIDFSGVSFTPWVTLSASENIGISENCALTLMIYMNGSDLESENAAATDDIYEMLNSGLDTDLINVVIFTGGTNRWHNKTMQAGECALWRVEDGGLTHLADLGVLNMGDAGTLSGFIDFSCRCFPAERYGLIFWDHGGGSIAGYGHDEVFDGSALTLLEMDYALFKSEARRKKFEFIGFDACLMATAEMAVVASAYARFLIASEDLEPGDGWDYAFLGRIGSTEFTGAEIGKLVTDYYVRYYGRGTTESVTMSVTDLAYAGDVMGAMGALMERCTVSLAENTRRSFALLAGRRYKTHTFGEGTRRDNDCDMVDIGDMAAALSDIYPVEAVNLQEALTRAVVYNRHNSLTDLSGLTSYYIFGGKNDAQKSLETYELLGMSREYTEYLTKFAGFLRAGGTITDPQTVETRLALWERSDSGLLKMVGKRPAGGVGSDSVWAHFEGRAVVLDLIGETREGELYAIPVQVNGVDADIVVFIGDSMPEGKVLGMRQEEGYIIQKGFTGLQIGDEIAVYYRTCRPGADRQEGWELSEKFKYNGSGGLTWQLSVKDDEFMTSTVITDITHGERYEDFCPL